MLPLFVRLEAQADGGLHIGAEPHQSGLTTTALVPAGELMERIRVLNEALSEGNSGGGVCAELSLLLGTCLFSGDVGDLLRVAILQAEVSAIVLVAEGELATWPWELAVDPASGARPAVDAGIVRAWGDPERNGESVRHGLLVVPRSHGAAKVKSVQAATSTLARKHQVDVYPADPVTGAGLRRALDGGALLVHLETDGQGHAQLDDGPVPLARLGVDHRTWFTLLAGSSVSNGDAQALREQGAPIVLGTQLTLSPHQMSATYRAIYKALSHGDSVADALVRARNALLKLGGPDDYAWAGPILYVAPNGSGALSALTAFPPQTLQREPSTEAQDDSAGRGGRGPHQTLLTPVGAPMSAPVFVSETLRRLSLGQGGRDELKTRAETLRALGGQPSSAVNPDPSLTPDQRIRQLSDALIDSLARPDDPLERPGGFEAKLAFVSQQQAVELDVVEQAAIGMRASRLSCLVAADNTDGVRLASAITQDVYNYHPREVPLNGQTDLFEPPLRGHEGQLTSGGGWLFRTAASNWRRDEIDAYQPEQADPTSRMPILARGAAGWHIHEGGWLVVSNAERLAEADLIGLSQALAAGVFEAQADHGGLCRLRIPNDFRVILVAEWTPAGLPASVPVTALRPMDDGDAPIERWIAVASERVGEPPDAPSAGGRRIAAEFLAERARWLRLCLPCPNSLMETALCHGIIKGGEPAEAAALALKLGLNPSLTDKSPTQRRFTQATLDGVSQDDLREATLELARVGQLVTGETYGRVFSEAGAAVGDTHERAVAVLDAASPLVFNLK